MPKNILITGASSGIGKAIALEFAKKEGAANHLILAARNQAKLEQVAQEVETLGAHTSVKLADFSKKESIAQLFTDLEKDFPKLDLVFNNAGLGFVKEAYLLSDDEVEQIIDVNVKGMILVGKKAAAMMIKQSSGHIVFTSSLAAYILVPQWSVYCASKWGITVFANILRQEVAPYGIKITTVHPGPVKTEFFDKNKANIDLDHSQSMQSAVTAEEVAQAIYQAIKDGKNRIFVPSSLEATARTPDYFPEVI
jgi:hypothetical protein